MMSHGSRVLSKIVYDSTVLLKYAVEIKMCTNTKNIDNQLKIEYYTDNEDARCENTEKMVYFQNLFLYGMAGAVVDRGVFCVRRCRIFRRGGKQGVFYPPAEEGECYRRVC